MTGDESPIAGLNTAIEHDGKTYHVQTEDSGARRPHVISHLFADGGTIIATRKTDYAALLALPDRLALIKRLIRAQHRSMLAAVRGIAGKPLPVVFPAFPLDTLVKSHRERGDRAAERPTSVIPTTAAPSNAVPNLDGDLTDLDDVIIRDLVEALDPE
jgi:hypothetical protein